MAKRSVRYTPEFKRQMVDLVRSGRKAASLAKEFGPSAWTIALWVKQDARDSGSGDGGLTSAEREELTRLRREIRRLKEEREILSKAAAWFATESEVTSKRSSGSSK
jgi:transposase